ncbi:hypothetical protein SAMN02910263_02618 [Butyrivibrio sp. INlla16]|nr:DUF4298 domain-containing protein [Butyrivibrio sp. INlla16]SDB51939.1 hypothetical protein SAMN02910263_02618 [Butyrivibrio sp. INlla16]
MYKIETFIPKESLQVIRQALLEVDAGHIGNYRGCLSYYPVTGVWFSEEGSNPTIGRQGEWSEEPELKVEVNVEDANKDRTVEAIRRFHPYEEPVINVIKLDTGDSAAFKRIKEMETILDTALQKLGAEDIEELKAYQPEIDRLAAYYSSQDWKDDFALDEAGKLPADLKRGVLSEDGIYNMLERYKELLDSID